MPPARVRAKLVMDAVSPAAARRLSFAISRVQSGFLMFVAIADLSVVSLQLRPVEGRLFGRQFALTRFAPKVTRSCRTIVTKFASTQLIPVIVEFLSNTQPEH